MKVKVLAYIAVFVLLLLFSPLLFRKRNVQLINNSGRVLAVGKRPWSGNEVGIYVNGLKQFSLWKDFFDFPVYVYPFSDGKKFLCVYDDDTSIPVFIVDLAGSNANDPAQFDWPPDGYTRQYLAERATNCVVEAKGKVRLPTYGEVEEVSASLTKMTPSQVKAISFPTADLGLFRFYWQKQDLLDSLATNRHSVWP